MWIWGAGLLSAHCFCSLGLGVTDGRGKKSFLVLLFLSVQRPGHLRCELRQVFVEDFLNWYAKVKESHLGLSPVNCLRRHVRKLSYRTSR